MGASREKALNATIDARDDGGADGFIKLRLNFNLSFRGIIPAVCFLKTFPRNSDLGGAHGKCLLLLGHSHRTSAHHASAPSPLLSPRAHHCLKRSFTYAFVFCLTNENMLTRLSILSHSPPIPSSEVSTGQLTGTQYNSSDRDERP